MDEDDDSQVEMLAESAAGSRHRARRPQGVPWTRALLTIVVGGPALYFGGGRPETVVAFLVVALALWVRLCTRTAAPLQVPRAAWLGVLVVGVTALQWVPLPGLREALAPDIAAQIEISLQGTNVVAWPGLSPTPGDTGLEAARLVGLLALFVAAAQLSWRTSAIIVVFTGTAVALVGFAHEALGLNAIYGRYSAEDIDLATSPALLTSFVNPNHQSSLLLLVIFAASALALDQHIAGLATRDPAKVDRYGDRYLAALAAMGIQLPALVLSLSRGALVSLALVAPLGLWLGLRRDPRRKTRAKRQRHMSPMRYVALLGSLGILLLVAQHGAWRELGTLGDVASPGSDAGDKLRMLAVAPELWSSSPWLGIGRGAFIDLYPPLAATPTHVLQTHLESAPATALAEWGPAVGGVFLAGVIAWWWTAWRRDADRRDAAARRIALCGLLAVGLHNGADFALEFLGVAAPAVALAGGLSSARRVEWPARRAGVMIGAALLGAIVLAWHSAPDTFGRREATNRAMQVGEIDPTALLARRPLDGRLHGLLARRAAEACDFATARARAKVATERLPGAIDGWLLLASAELELGDEASSDAAMKVALERLHDAPSDELRAWLLARHPDPESLAAIAPDDPDAWRRLVEALVVIAPRHADAVAAARARAHPDDPAPLQFRFELAMQAGQPALALHHARLWRQLAPAGAGPHRAVAVALRSMNPARLTEARDALEAGLARTDLPSAADHGALEDVLLRTLLEIGDAESRARAREVAEQLRGRPADRQTQRGREPWIREALSEPGD